MSDSRLRVGRIRVIVLGMSVLLCPPALMSVWAQPSDDPDEINQLSQPLLTFHELSLRYDGSNNSGHLQIDRFMMERALAREQRALDTAPPVTPFLANHADTDTSEASSNVSWTTTAALSHYYADRSNDGSLPTPDGSDEVVQASHVRIDAGAASRISRTIRLSAQVTANTYDKPDIKPVKQLLTFRELSLVMGAEDSTARWQIGRVVIGNGIAHGQPIVDFYNRIAQSVDTDSGFLQDRIFNRIGQIGFGVDWYGAHGNVQFYLAPKITGNDNLNSNAQRSAFLRWTPSLDGQSHLDLIGGTSEFQQMAGLAFSHDLFDTGLAYLEMAWSKDKTGIYQVLGRAKDTESGALTLGMQYPVFSTLQLLGEVSYQGAGLTTTERRNWAHLLTDGPVVDPDGFMGAAALLDRIGTLGRRYGYIGLEQTSPMTALTFSSGLLYNLDDQSRSFNLTAQYNYTNDLSLFSRLRYSRGSSNSELGALGHITRGELGLKYLLH